MLIKRLAAHLPTLILIGLVITGLKTYSVWNQIDEGFIAGNGTDYFKNIVSHTARLILMHPVKVISSNTGIDQNTIFSVEVLLIFFIISKRLSKWIRFSNKINNSFGTTLSIRSILLIAFLFMNGRNTFSFLGNVILFDLYILLFYGFKYWKIILLSVLAGLFCNVSSGTYSVFVLNVVLHVAILSYKRLFSKTYWGSIVCLLFGVILYLPIFLAGVTKNLNYYSGSVSNMLNHGYGYYILEYLTPLLLILIILTPILIALTKYATLMPMRNLRHTRAIFFLCSIFGGLFGYSSLLGALPVLLFFIFTYFDNHNYWFSKTV